MSGKELYEASKGGNTEEVKRLIEIKAPVDWQEDGSGVTPLLIASHNGNTDTARLLVESKAAVDKADEDGWTPLYFASQKGKTDTARLLIESKAAVDKAGEHGVTPLYVASHNGNTDTARLLVESKAAVDWQDGFGWTPLYVASEQGFTDTARLLIESKAAVDKAGEHGTTPLYVASQEGKTDTARLLIESKAAVDKDRKDGVTPLYVASQQGFTDTARLLIESKAAVDKTDKDGATPLWTASFHGFTDTARLLIESKAAVDKASKDGDTPLYIASQEGKTDTAMLLIESKAAVDKANNVGDTPLIIAANWNNMTTVRALVESGADTTIRGDDNKTAAEWAKQEGHDPIAEYLITEAPRVQARMRAERDGKAPDETKRDALLSKRPSSLRLSELGDYLTLRAEELRLVDHDDLIKAVVDEGYDGETLLEADDDELLELCKRSKPKQRRLKKAIAKLKRWDSEPSEDAKRPSIGFSLSPGDIKVGDRVGSGNFGDVFLVNVKGVPERCVIKVPKDVDRTGLVKEYTNCMKIGGQRNLLRFIGLVAYKNRQCFVTEYCARGSLDTLHEKENLISRFFHIATGLCLAVAHLHSFPKPIIHRDIACRNVLVKADWTVVLCDYGLARETGGSDYYIASTRTALPELWMSPEALNGKFRPEGDVWQIGVTMWEVLTKGWKPYFSHSGRIARHEWRFVVEGIREGEMELKVPQGADAKAAAFVKACCTHDYKARPSVVHMLLDHVPDGQGFRAIQEHGSDQIKSAAFKVRRERGEVKAPVVLGLCSDSDEEQEVLAVPEGSLQVDASGMIDLSGEEVDDALNDDEYTVVDD